MVLCRNACKNQAHVDGTGNALPNCPLCGNGGNVEVIDTTPAYVWHVSRDLGLIEGRVKDLVHVFRDTVLLCCRYRAGPMINGTGCSIINIVRLT
jgi:hypothetical protein